MPTFADINDVTALWRNLTPAETEMATKLLGLVSDCLRYEAGKVGKNLDAMIVENPVLASVAKSVTVDVVKRYMNDNSVDGPAFSQMSQAAGGYSVSGTYLVPGGGMFIKKSELARLGLRRQKIGGLDLWPC